MPVRGPGRRAAMGAAPVQCGWSGDHYIGWAWRPWPWYTPARPVRGSYREKMKTSPAPRVKDQGKCNAPGGSRGSPKDALRRCATDCAGVYDHHTKPSLCPALPPPSRGARLSPYSALLWRSAAPRGRAHAARLPRGSSSQLSACKPTGGVTDARPLGDPRPIPRAPLVRP